ncbi:MAG: hypothetical protein ACFFDQ_12035 [Candidatus Thorarchaeota archaeon]
MHKLEVSHDRIRQISTRVDNRLLRVGEKIARFLIDYRYLISVMLIGFIVWAIVFNVAVIDYIDSNRWVTRTTWLGPLPEPGTIQLFGFTIEYQVEGYSDYSFYYVHWGYNSLYGVMPYSPEYGVLELDGITNQNGAHMFPPFTSYLYAAGIALGNFMGWTNWGIGFLLAAFGYLTALPVYGIASELSTNKRVGEAAALTYLLNPLMLYHIDFLWFNPTPFVFFFFAGFYMLVRGKKITGTLLIVSAALFKQTAWFLGIPLVVYLLVRPRERKAKDNKNSELDETLQEKEEKVTDPIKKLQAVIQPFTRYFDLRNFMISVVIVLIFVGAVVLPFLVAQPHFLDYWKLALGSYSFGGNFTEPPPYNVPMRIQVLFILAGNPEFAEILDAIMISGGPLGFGVVVCAGLMILKDRYIGEEKLYLRRILFFTLIIMLVVNLFGPRGVFKYYFAALMPFFSIFASARMIRGTGEHVPFSASMVWVPITLTLMILIPPRNIYLAFVFLIFIGYLLAPVLDRLYHLVKSPFRYIRQIIKQKTQISSESLKVEDILVHVKRKRYVVNIITQSLLIGAGLFFITFGWWTTSMAIGVDIVTGLEFILVFSAAFVFGFQLLSIGFSLTLYGNLRTQLNGCLRDLSSITAAIIWIFGFRTYFLSWLIDLLPERQLLVLSSVFVSIWACSLLIKQSNRTRILTDIMLIGGLAIGLHTWNSLTNLPVFLLGNVGLCAVMFHLLLILVHLFDNATLFDSETRLPNEFGNSGPQSGDS